MCIHVTPYGRSQSLYPRMSSYAQQRVERCTVRFKIRGVNLSGVRVPDQTISFGEVLFYFDVSACSFAHRVFEFM